jgi:hypothetical protein
LGLSGAKQSIFQLNEMAAFSKRELREARCGDDLVADASGLNVRRLQNSG